MKPEVKFMGLGACILILLLVLSASLFVVKEGTRSLIIRLGEFVVQEDKPKVFVPGLHLKYPLIDRVITLSVKIQSFNEKSSEILSKEQKPVVVDYYIKWRIKDLQQYYKAILTKSSNHQSSFLTARDLRFNRTEELLRNYVGDALRIAFGERYLHDIISVERENILDYLLEQTNINAASLGIEVVDIRIKRLDYSKEVSASVYERMRAKRQQVANANRADGEYQAEIIRSTADKDSRIIVAEANRQAAEYRAEGERQAAAIYNEAYASNQAFYKLYRSLLAYQNSMSERDLLVLDPHNVAFYQQMLGGKLD